MERIELMDMLDMEELYDFEYFEQLADLLECEEDIPFELFFEVISEASGETMSELIGIYMEELSDNIPDCSAELFTIVETIKQRLLLLSETLQEEETKRTFAEELYRFRQWYTDPYGATANQEPCSILEAITLRRAENIGGEKMKYNFENSLNYKLEEISIGLGAFEKIELSE
ncbi:MAG: hypothetical protein EOM59_04335 [Clostridia bacterium]|nr:hypothetical protein [Clostridia bacterium]